MPLETLSSRQEGKGIQTTARRLIGDIQCWSLVALRELNASFSRVPPLLLFAYDQDNTNAIQSEWK